MADAHRAWVTAGIDEPAHDALSRALPASALWSLLLDVCGRRAAERTPADLVRQWARDGFVQPAAVDQRTLNAVDGHLLAAASAFEALELSPLAPLGACSVVGPTSQHKVVSALRGTEVVSDPTNVLALECARRLRADAASIVRLATCHRCVRAQPVPRGAGYAPHFRIFCLASGGREQRQHAFTLAALREHIDVHLAAFDRLERHGYGFPDRRVVVLASPARAPLADRLAAGLGGVAVERAGLEHPYYDGLRFQIHTRSRAGDALPLVDGGIFTWLGGLTSNRRLVLVASGMGAQLAALLFRRDQPA